MKKTKLFALCALIVCFACLFTACSSGGKIYNEKTYEAANDVNLYTSAQKLDMDGYSFSATRGSLVLFSKQTLTNAKYFRVYDMAKNTMIGEYNDSTVTDVTLGGLTVDGETIPFYTVTYASMSLTEEEITYRFVLYTASGEKIAEYTDEDLPQNVTKVYQDLLVFDDVAYRFTADGKYEKAFDLTDLNGSIPNVQQKVDSYYYLFDENEITAYDKDMKPVFYYKIPLYATNVSTLVLENGNILLQYYVEKFDEDKDYDVLQKVNANWKKYDLKQMILTVKNGKVKEMDAEYVLLGGVNRKTNPDAFNGLNKKFDNYAAVYKIENKYVLDDEMKLAILGNDGKVDAWVTDFAEEWMTVQVMRSTRIVTSGLDRAYLYTYGGKQIGEITGYFAITEKFIVGENAIYDLDLNPVLDLKTKEYAFENTIGENVLLTDKEGNEILFTGTEKSLGAGADVTRLNGGELYTVKNGTVYTLYNSDGVAVNMTSNAAIQARATYEGFAIVSTVENENAVYYRLS